MQHIRTGAGPAGLGDVPGTTGRTGSGGGSHSLSRCSRSAAGRKMVPRGRAEASVRTMFAGGTPRSSHATTAGASRLTSRTESVSRASTRRREVRRSVAGVGMR
ncbi:hypothetical protein ADK86_10580, partial [Streptomyces sp. NRRL F-5755]